MSSLRGQDQKGRAQRRTVVLGMYGSTLDVGKGPKRWERWRPTVALCQQADLSIARFELLCQTPFLEAGPTVAEDMRQVSPQTEVRIVPIDLPDPWDLEDVFSKLHDFARAYAFAPEQEDYLVHITTGTHVVQICWFLLTEARHIPGRLIQSAPPRRDAPETASVGSYNIIDLDLSKYDRIAARAALLRGESRSFLKGGIATQNAAYNRMIEEIEHVAIASRAPLLLTGPTGAGKSQLARRIYELRKHRHQIAGELVDVNCATLRGDGAMSALFGHVKGAFTGAVSERQGLLRRANGGMLFLDEIGELGLDEQAMLLRAIEDKTFLSVGSDKEQRSDFLLIAGTNRDLDAEVRAGRFREDLFARVNLWTFSLPGLADRPEDVEPNLDHELSVASTRLGTRVTMSSEARARFLSFARGKQAIWSASFRDLNAAVTRMATLAPGGRIRGEEVEAEIVRLLARWHPSGVPRDAPPSRRSDVAPPHVGLRSPSGASALDPSRRDPEDLAAILGPDRAAALDRFDQVQLAEVVRVCRRARSISEAGRILFAASRSRRTSVNDADRLRKYLARFDLSWADFGAKHPE